MIFHYKSGTDLDLSIGADPLQHKTSRLKIKTNMSPCPEDTQAIESDTIRYIKQEQELISQRLKAVLGEDTISKKSYILTRSLFMTESTLRIT
jgi:hypothetical protein